MSIKYFKCAWHIRRAHYIVLFMYDIQREGGAVCSACFHSSQAPEERLACMVMGWLITGRIHDQAPCWVIVRASPSLLGDWKERLLNLFSFEKSRILFRKHKSQMCILNGESSKQFSERKIEKEEQPHHLFVVTLGDLASADDVTSFWLSCWVPAHPALEMTLAEVYLTCHFLSYCFILIWYYALCIICWLEA